MTAFDEMARLLFPRTNFGARLGLERIGAALSALGDPHRAAPALHVAGTNGKGSTCAFADAALRAAGLRVGLYTSPHLRHFCERIRVGGEMISEDAAASLFDEIVRAVPGALDDGGLTFFEFATAMAFLAFARARVDVMVIEVGLGGRLDATNVLERPLATAVASLGLEHTQYLGPTLLDIAREKAGIFKRGAIAVSAGQPAEAARVLQREADRADVPLWRPGRDYRFESRERFPFCYQRGWRVKLPEGSALALAGHHQRGNAALACAMLEAAAEGGLRVGSGDAARGLVAASWPARMQVVADRPLTWIDGAHNPHAVRALAAGLPSLLGGRPLHLVFGALADKDAAAMLAELLPLATTVHLCAPESPRAQPVAQLEAAARSLGRGDTNGHPTVAAALSAARAAAGPEGAVLVCGSLYLAGEALGVVQGSTRPAMPGEHL